MAGDLMDGQYNDRFILRGEHSSHIKGLSEARGVSITFHHVQNPSTIHSLSSPWMSRTSFCLSEERWRRLKT